MKHVSHLCAHAGRCISNGSFDPHKMAKKNNLCAPLRGLFLRAVLLLVVHTFSCPAQAEQDSMHKHAFEII